MALSRAPPTAAHATPPRTHRYWLGARAAIAHMLTQPLDEASGVRGRVINITSQHGMVAAPRDFAYGVGKAASVYMTRQVRRGGGAALFASRAEPTKKNDFLER